MKSRKGIVLLGIVTILLWISYLPYLKPLPFSLQPAVQKIAGDLADAPESVKEKAGFSGKNQAEIERLMMRKVIVRWLIKAVPVLLGLLAGLFLLLRKNYGRIMAILVAVSWIVLNVTTYIRSPNIWDRIYMTHVTLLKERPLYVIRNDILPLILFLFTIFYLMLPSIRKEFKENKNREQV